MNLEQKDIAKIEPQTPARAIIEVILLLNANAFIFVRGIPKFNTIIDTINRIAIVLIVIS